MTKSRRNILYLRILTIILSVMPFLQAQQVLTRFDHLSIEEGLSQSAVFCIMQDKTGFIWIGTEDGLNRYDGYNFLVKKNDPSDSTSISGNTIFSIFQDSRGLIWVGTEGNGVNIYDPVHDSFKRIKYEKDNNNSLSNNIVRAICEDKEGNIWIGTADGLNKYDPVKHTFKKYFNNLSDENSLSYNFILSLFYDSRGILWVGTDKGLNKYNPAEDNFIRYYSSSNNNSLNGNNILSFAEDKKGNLWIGTYDGVNKLNIKSGIFTRYSPNDGGIKDIRSLCLDGDNLWIGSRPDGLLKLNTITEKFERYIHVKDESAGISRNSVYSIFKDKSGSVWIGTWGGGVNVLHKNAQNFKHYKSLSDDKNEISSNDIRALYKENDSIIWVGTRNDGLNKYNRHTGKAVRYLHNSSDPKSISHNTVFTIFKDGNVLWVGTRDGLNKYNPSTGTFTKYYSQFKSAGNEEGIVKIYKTKSGLFWLGTRGRGILIFDPRENKFIKKYDVDSTGTGLSSPFAYDIHEDKEGKIWIATINGLNKYDPLKNRFSYFYNNETDSEGIGSNVIWSIHEDKLGNLWFGTRGGMSLYNRGKNNFRTFSEKDGLPNQVVYSILEDEEGCLWLSTNNGISKFDKNKYLNKGEIVFSNYTVSDGIQSPEFNFGAYYKSSDGELFFGGINGFNSFYSGEIKTNENIPPVVITDLIVMNRNLPVRKIPVDGVSIDSAMVFKKEINLSYKDNIFTFVFAALNYFAPEKNKYMYRLTGFNDNWETVNSGQRSVTYTNLDPGEYVFQVKASNNDGVWNPLPAEVLINISPPFWGTVYFRIGAAISLSALVLFLFYIRIKKVNEEKIKQENFSRQLIEKQESERKRIAAELHDSLGQNLLLIKNRAVLGLQLANGNNEITEHVSEISSIASETLKEVREISHNLRPYQLDRLGLSDAVKGAVKKVAESSNINFDLHCDNIDNVLAKEKEINVYRILQEALNNIIKHSDAASARLSFTITNKELVIIISDDGRGFNNGADNLHGGHGLAGIQERVKILRGKLLVNSAPGAGVQLTIIIPVDK